jgi:hypothetical protein
VALQQYNIFVDRFVQSQFAHQFVKGSDPAEADCLGSFGNLIMNAGILEHGIALILILSSHQPGFEILLVTEVGFVVFFIHLKCAPFGCIGNIQVPIITNSDAHFRVFQAFLKKSRWFRV